MLPSSNTHTSNLPAQRCFDNILTTQLFRFNSLCSRRLDFIQATAKLRNELTTLGSKQKLFISSGTSSPAVSPSLHPAQPRPPVQPHLGGSVIFNILSFDTF